MTPARGIAGPDLALVLFSGRVTIPWLRLLRPGFRHCFVLLRSNGQWLYYDPMMHYTFAAVVGVYPILDLLRFFRDSGCRWRLVRPSLPEPQPQSWRPYTCVEAVKRVLGLRQPWVLTPWQLYCRLARERRSGRKQPARDNRGQDDQTEIAV